MRPLIIIPQDPPFVYRVESQSRRGIEHQVDLSCYNFIGRCSCENFDHSLRHLIESYGQNITPSDQFRCKHIKQVREVVLNTLLFPHLKDHDVNVNLHIIKQSLEEHMG